MERILGPIGLRSPVWWVPGVIQFWAQKPPYGSQVQRSKSFQQDCKIGEQLKIWFGSLLLFFCVLQGNFLDLDVALKNVEHIEVCGAEFMMP